MSVNVVQQSNLKEVSGTVNIKTVIVNGTNIPPDANKNVNIFVPTKTSQLQNDSSFASIDDVYVKANALVGSSALFQDVAKYASGLKTLAGDGKSVSNTAVGSAKKPIYFADGVPVAGSYTLSDACAKGVATTVASGNANLVTSGAVYSALQNAGGVNVELGNWTPQIYGYSGNYLFAVGKYCKIGKMVFIRFSVAVIDNPTPVSVGSVDGLPYPGVPQDLPSPLSGYITIDRQNKGYVGAGANIMGVNESLSSGSGFLGSGWYQSIR